MKMKAIILLAAGLAAGCGIQELENGKTGPVVPPYITDDTKVPVTYVLAFDYRDGYDWHSDRDYGYAECDMVLFANGRRMKTVPVGHAYSLLPDADMHRVSGGAIYSDYSSDTHTIIMRNGIELFRYPAREMILTLDVVTDPADGSEDIYTVGGSRTGTGFSARRNGEVLVESYTGFAYPHSTVDEAGVFSFCYCETIPSGTGQIERHYIYSTDKGITQTALREDIGKVWDAAPGYGYVADLVGVKSPVLIRDDGSSAVIALGLASATVTSCRFITTSSPVLLEIVAQTESYRSAALSGARARKVTRTVRGVWKEATCALKWEDDRKAYGFRCDEGGLVAGVMSGSSSKLPDIANVGLMSYTLPDSFTALSERSVSVRADSLVAGLSSRLGEKPLLWSPHRIDTLDVNGFIAEVRLEMVDKTEQP